MLTLRQRIFVIISIIVGVILALLLLYYFVFKNESKPRELIQNIFKTDSAPEQSAAPETPSAATTPPVFGKYSPEVYAKQVARVFVERFASFSNQNNNQHLADVLPMSTPVMQKWLQTQSQSAGNVYQGQTTLVIASRVSSIGADKATVLLDVQQEIENKDGAQVIQRSGRVELVKVGEEWKVEGFYWDK